MIKSICTLICLLAITFTVRVSAQPTMSTATLTHFMFGTIYQTALKDPATWLLYLGANNGGVDTAYLFKTTDGGKHYKIMTPFSADEHISRMAHLGDTVVAVGKRIYRSVDFGDTWTICAPPAPGYTWDNAVVMPGRKLWLSGYNAKDTFKLWETDGKLAAYDLKSTSYKYTFRFLSRFSRDSVYYVSGPQVFPTVHFTADNGKNWTSKLIPLDFSTYRLSFIQFFNSKEASVFTFYSGFPKNYLTRNGFAELTEDTLGTKAGFGLTREVIGWITCSDRDYLVSDIHEDSECGLQDIDRNAAGELLYGTFYPGPTHRLDHTGDIALAATSADLYTNFISGLCTGTGIAETMPVSTVHIVPNPSRGLFTITGAKGAYAWQVYNLNGALVAEGHGGQANIDLRAAPKGWYCMRLLQDGQWSAHTLLLE